jgi:hypothetical protein
MKLKSLITAASIVLLPLAASAATLIIPAAGTGPGANGSRWQSEVTLHNTSNSSAVIGMIFHDGNGAGQSTSVVLGPRATTTVSDIVATSFGRESGTGAIEVRVPDAVADRVVINSRTFNSSAAGQFGQDVPAINVNDAAIAGDTVVLQTPSSAADNRFNFGLYAVTDAKVRWELVRADGTVAATLDQTFTAGTQQQFNGGIETLLASTEQNDDVIDALVISGKVIAYGSAINNASGDPTFVPGQRAHSDIRVKFVGVDIAGNGSIDVTDANNDGVLDQPIDLYLTAFPTYFRVVVTGPNGEPVTLSFINPPDDAHFVNADAVQWYPNPSEGPQTTLKVLATYGGVSEVLTIPVRLH